MMFESFRRRRGKSETPSVPSKHGSSPGDKRKCQSPGSHLDSLKRSDCKESPHPRNNRLEKSDSWRLLKLYSKRTTAQASEVQCLEMRPNSEMRRMVRFSLRRRFSTQNKMKSSPLIIHNDMEDHDMEATDCIVCKSSCEMEQEDEYAHEDRSSYRSIMDDLCMEFYEDPYADLLNEQASIRINEKYFEDVEIDVLTPLPSHSIQISEGSLLRRDRLSDIDNDEYQDDIEPMNAIETFNENTSVDSDSVDVLICEEPVASE